jgi:hypothetical protein
VTKSCATLILRCTPKRSEARIRYAEFKDEMRTAAGLGLEAKEDVRQHKT